MDATLYQHLKTGLIKVFDRGIETGASDAFIQSANNHAYAKAAA